MKKRAALIERVRQLRAWLEACPPGARVRRLALLAELAAIYAALAASKQIIFNSPSNPKTGTFINCWEIFFFKTLGFPGGTTEMMIDKRSLMIENLEHRIHSRLRRGVQVNLMRSA